MAVTRTRRPMRKFIAPKNCFFCKEKKKPYFADVEVLRRFITDRGKIVGRARSGICAKHQRDVSLSIKHARHIALIAYQG